MRSTRRTRSSTCGNSSAGSRRWCISTTSSPPRSAKHVERCDVLVVGGGNAGCAAALAAARSGARVLLVERYGFLGGTATASMVGPWMTFHSGNDRIVGGIAQEIVERLVAMGASPGHIRDSSDYVATITPFDPEVHKALLFEMMREAGVDLLLHAYFLETVCDEHARVRSARFATVAGTREVTAGRTVDATADAFVAFSAGVRMQETAGLRGRVQPATMMFRLSHIDVGALATYVRQHPDQMRTSLKTHERTPGNLTAVAGLYALWDEARARGEITVQRELVSLFVTPYPDEMTVNMTRVVDIDPLDPDDLTRAEIEARAQVMELLRFFRTRVPGFERARIAATATQIGIRESRRIVGEYTLTAQDVLEARQFPDAIARSAYPIDIHNPSGSGTVTHRLPPGASYEIPYRCLVPLEVDDLIVAGRCISTTHEAHASTRLTPTVMTLGQAAGMAAAISVKSHTPFRRIDARLLRDRLAADGVDLRRPSAAANA
ncbi:MAG: FAD-dependent oxidoreductase [Candidatus Eremiobacteraeota bacterium]|nr:FAD-dependent oxidoreductase [Candidatus Eremiobacteraeota bacterium]